MMNNYKYSDVELKELLKTIIILIDTREQENKHITDYFDLKKIPYHNKKLEFGDYSCILPASSDYGIIRDLYFDSDIIIERKNSLEELSSNFCEGRERFQDEFLRSGNCKKIIMVEKGSLGGIIDGTYNTQFKSTSFVASLLTYRYRYNLDIDFVNKDKSGMFIYYNFYYYLREILK